MYMKLYGISETWLSLVSQTTRLANVIDCLRVNKEKRDVDSQEIIERRKQRLESMVCSFAAMGRQGFQQGSNSGMFDESCNIARGHMVRALNAALVIFFYRRIKGVNPWILQEHVDAVIQALKDFDTSCQLSKVEGPGTPWPGFIAGCEALYPSQNEYLLGWFDRAFAQTGFTRFHAARTCMQEVWTRRNRSAQGASEKTGGRIWTWIDVSKEHNVHLLLC